MLINVMSFLVMPVHFADRVDYTCMLNVEMVPPHTDDLSAMQYNTTHIIISLANYYYSQLRSQNIPNLYFQQVPSLSLQISFF